MEMGRVKGRKENKKDGYNRVELAGVDFVLLIVTLSTALMGDTASDRSQGG